jgi:hypothetical protein
MLGRHYGNWALAALLVSRATGLTVRGQFEGSMSVLLAAAAMALVTAAVCHLLNAAAWHAGIVVIAAAGVGVVAYALALRLLAPATLQTVFGLVRAFMRRDRARLAELLSQPR